MSVREGKAWGETEAIEQSPNMELHKIEIKKGGYCSQHKHQSKINGFLIISGELEIQRWKDYGLCDKTILKAGGWTKVPPGEQHRFKALKKTVAYEIYWVELNHNDIQRENVGGI